MSDQEIQEKLHELLDSEIKLGAKMLRIVRSIASLPKSKARDDVLRAIGWLNHDVDLLHARAAGELNKQPAERSENLLKLIEKQADSIEQQLALVDAMLTKLRS